MKQGLSEIGKCPKGRRCNYLHVFRNPSLKTNEICQHHKRSKTQDYLNKKKKKKTKTSHHL